ncbi:hypothetical protein C0Q70_02002 [Pomacea canaliculata]|uniref:EF-hand domain-containing protein n=1 Tax=Pomacea canaliculata TaxID=400727 RepID=A0A2T7Q125_POMCA|nr:hypothetical protein C0Q70_02002 [Pomacea canaliculata]
MDYLTPDFVPGANPRSSGAQSRRQSQSVPRLQVGGQDRRPSVLQQRPGVRDDRRSSSIALRVPGQWNLSDSPAQRQLSASGLLPSATEQEKASVIVGFGRLHKNSEVTTAWRSALKALVPTMLLQKIAEAKDGVPKRRKSFSTTENIENFGKDPNVRLEEHMKLAHLQQLMKEFSQHRPEDIVVQQGSGYFPPKLMKRTPGCMNLVEFQTTIAKVLGTSEYSEYLEKLFVKLDTSCDGYVDWNEFCTYMLLLYREQDYLRAKQEMPFMVEPVIRHIVHNRQEATTKIVALDAPVRYVTISKEGAMTVWLPSLACEKTYTVAGEEEEAGSAKRRFKMWVTDAVYMRNCQKVAIGSTSRDIRFYDVSTNQYFEEFHLFAMSDVPYCFDYWYNKKVPNSESLLIFGVDTGAIHLMYFLKPITQLFETPFQKDGGVQKIFMQVRRSAPLSFSLNQLKDMTFGLCGVWQGVECFDYSKRLNILVTGSADHQVRVWNPYVTHKPVAVLSGHATGVIGVMVHEGFRHVFSYSKDVVIKVWDIKEHTCLQTVILKFPSSLHGRVPDHGQFPIHLQPSPHDALLVTCNDYIGLLKLGRVEQQPLNTMPTTHDTQLCCAIYNTFFKQVVTGCDSSSIAVWDVESGNKSIVFSNAHGDEEITCMVFDDSCRRLISGARNGTIKVWNFQNGHNLHKLEPVGEAEVTGMLALTEKKIILAVGWSRQIVMYDDSDADNMYVTANTDWKGGQLHKDDILTVDYCPPNYIATASFDSEILVWDLETEKVHVRLRKGQPTNLKRQLEELQKQSQANCQPSSSQGSRPNSRHRTSHKVPNGHPVPVDKLLFLKGRASVKHTEKAMLLSSEAGVIRWWNIFSQKPEMGYFYAPDLADESVLAMCSKPNNSILITGDTQGIIKVWDIMDYCVRPQERRVKTAPPLECLWKAHDAAVVSVQYIQHTAGDFVLSASTDKTARLWTPEGHFIGTFGQSNPWNLKHPSTWAHPQTPWTTEEENSVIKNDIVNETKTEGDSSPDDEHSENAESEMNEEITESPEETSKTVSYLATPNTKFLTFIHSNTVTFVSVVTIYSNVPHGLRLKYRSQTFAFGVDRSGTSKTSLGLKVEQELMRQQRDRQGRRQVFGEIEVKQTARFGKICSPYQALTTPLFEDITLPRNLPLSSRMISKGYSSNNLTADAIRSMDFSYGSPDTPPSTQQGSSQHLKKTLVTAKVSEERGHQKFPPIKSGRNSQNNQQTIPNHLGPLKKFHTVA